MHKLRADAFFKAYEKAATFHQVLWMAPPNMTLHLPVVEFDQHVKQITVLVEELTALGLIAAATSARRALEALKGLPQLAYEGRDTRRFLPEDRLAVHEYLSHTTSRVPDDLIGQVLLVIDPAKVDLYRQPAIFGDEVFKAFPSANEDISEAGTCLALDRGTACVMHLMRVIEVGLSVLAGTIGIAKQNDWGRYLREIDQALAARMKAAGARSADEQFYAEVAETIDRIRRAYRNPTMHPEKTYSPDRAEEILQSVRSFMRLLTMRLRE